MSTTKMRILYFSRRILFGSLYKLLSDISGKEMLEDKLEF